MATLAERLAEAEAAYHDLVIGKAVVEVRDANGQTLRYTQANRAAMAAYIQDLKRQIDSTGHGPLWLIS
jgi:hypothetical protein